MKKFLALFLLAALAFPALAAAPKAKYVVTEDKDYNEIVWRVTGKGREKTDIKTLPVEDRGWSWFQADGAVWGFGSPWREDGEAEAHIVMPLGKGEVCRDIEGGPIYDDIDDGVEINPYWPEYDALICVASDKAENLIFINIDDDGKIRRLGATPGLLDSWNGEPRYDVVYIDPSRSLITYSVPGTKRGKKSGLWHGAAVLEIFTNDNKGFEKLVVTPVAEPDATTEYRAVGYDDESGNLIIERRTVKSAKEWEKLDRGVSIEKIGKTEEISVPVPPAG